MTRSRVKSQLNMKKLIVILLVLLTGVSVLIGQEKIEGHIYDDEGQPLDGAQVFFTPTETPLSSNEEGFFALEFDQFIAGSLIISYIGFRTDTVYISEPGYYQFRLVPNTEIKEVLVKGRAKGTGISNSVQKVETINAIELTKAACCDLAGCFNTEGSVQVNTTNVVTNSKELRLLGLSGVYNQILMDGMPMFMGNTYTFGISHYPGTLINQIMIAKGTSSVLQGYDAISGQINVVTKKYKTTPSLLLNGYINNFGERQFNYHQAYEIGDKLKATTSFHTVMPSERMDMNDDGFIDMPLIRRSSFYQTFEYGDTDQTGYSNMNMVQYLDEKRVGGTLTFDPMKDAGTTNDYGHFIQLNQVNVISKHYYRWSGRQGVGIQTSYQNHLQDSWFGLLRYQSNMHNAYVNLQFESIYGEDNMFKGGISYRYFDIDELVSFAPEEQFRDYGGRYHRIESVPGVYAENTLNLMDNHLNIITAMRIDLHSEFGTFYTPRVLVRYIADEHLVLRGSAGKGYRTVNFLSEYAQITGGTRNLVVLENPRPEEAYNTGISANYTRRWGLLEMDAGVDYFYTYFINQVFPDFDRDPLSVFIFNSRDQVRSHSLQADLKLEYDQWLELKIIYNYLDVLSNETGERVSLPFIMKHRVTNTLSIRPFSIPWYFDINAHWNGIQRLPDNLSELPEIYHVDQFSTPFWDLNAQVTYKVGNWELYLGCENILGFMQFNPIRSADDPFGQFFDISSVWGPTRGREYYFGFRYTLDKKQ